MQNSTYFIGFTRNIGRQPKYLEIVISTVSIYYLRSYLSYLRYQRGNLADDQ
jgi:hypothetical protein